MRTKKVILAMAGGGSGGHVYPIKSLIEFLASKEQFYNKIQTIYWFGNKESLEYKEFLSIPKQQQLKVKFVSISSGKLRREKSFKAVFQNIRDILLVIKGFVQSFYYLHKYKIGVIFCKGGHVSAPIVLAGALLRKRIIAHESDTHPGLASRIATPFAEQVFTGFDNVFPKAKVVGQILSDDLYFDNSQPPKTQNTKQLLHIYDQNLQHKTVVLVLGGSLGSKTLYDALEQVLETQKTFQDKFIFVVVGGFMNKKIDKQFERFKNVFVFDYLSQKEMAVACYYSDIGLTRGGTTSLAEQKLYNMKLLIVPIPRTHDQYDNAKYYIQKYQDILIDQQKNFQKELIIQLERLIGFHKKRETQDIQKQIFKAKNIIFNTLVQNF